MEAHSQTSRVNGVKMNLHRLTDEELLNTIGHTESRLDAVWSDLARLGGELALRPHLLPPTDQQQLEIPGNIHIGQE